VRPMLERGTVVYADWETKRFSPVAPPEWTFHPVNEKGENGPVTGKPYPVRGKPGDGDFGAPAVVEKNKSLFPPNIWGSCVFGELRLN